MTWFVFARVLFVAAVAYSASLVRPVHEMALVNVLFGAGLAGLVVVFETQLRDTAVSSILGAVIGGTFGLSIAKTITTTLFWANTNDSRVAFLHTVTLLALTYLGLVVGGRKGEWLEPARLISLFRATAPKKHFKILDTSVIIDGRIADICETGFLDGTLVIPQFVLKELQFVADSSDAMKRNRGRRGLDILQKIQKMTNLDVVISDVDFPDVKEVDLKLIELARSLEGKIVTNDFNLNKVAKVQNVGVVNLNELANALKPIFLPGEEVTVRVMKPGEETHQGVGYLEDGTMVVIENGRQHIGEQVTAQVTSVLQTNAGRMVFAKFDRSVSKIAPTKPENGEAQHADSA
jgi:uncharacterized protein YacL